MGSGNTFTCSETRRKTQFQKSCQERISLFQYYFIVEHFKEACINEKCRCFNDCFLQISVRGLLSWFNGVLPNQFYTNIMSSSTITLFSKLQNFRKYFRNLHFFRIYFQNLTIFSKFFKESVNVESIFENFVISKKV